MPKGGFWSKSNLGPKSECVSAQPTELHSVLATLPAQRAILATVYIEKQSRMSADWILTPTQYTQISREPATLIERVHIAQTAL